MALPKGAGSLSERITVSRFERVLDPETGRYSEKENVIASYFAQVRAVQAKDNVIADQMRDLRTHEIITRAQNCIIRQGDIIEWKGIKLDVRSTRPAETWMIFDCVTRSA